jgi:hypothetical protein
MAGSMPPIGDNLVLPGQVVYPLNFGMALVRIKGPMLAPDCRFQIADVVC